MQKSSVKTVVKSDKNTLNGAERCGKDKREFGQQNVIYRRIFTLQSDKPHVKKLQHGGDWQNKNPPVHKHRRVISPLERKISAWRTEARDERPSDRTSYVPSYEDRE